ncbi:hypothetical protein ACF06W_14340 [Streptomyces albus]|uniref:hypothetical protein n=1 Tax=Streptomyces albus TaxID=1888 RepID=UPI00370103FB
MGRGETAGRVLRRLGTGAGSVVLLAGGLAGGLWAAAAVRTVPEDTSPPPPPATPAEPAPAAGKPPAEPLSPAQRSARREADKQHITGIHQRGGTAGVVISTDLPHTAGAQQVARRIAAGYLGEEYQRCRGPEEVGSVMVEGRDGRPLGGPPQGIALVRVGPCPGPSAPSDPRFGVPSPVLTPGWKEP